MNRSPEPKAPDRSRPEDDLLQVPAKSALTELDELKLPSSEAVYRVGKMIQFVELLAQNERLRGCAGRPIIGRQWLHHTFAYS